MIGALMGSLQTELSVFLVLELRQQDMKKNCLHKDAEKRLSG